MNTNRMTKLLKLLEENRDYRPAAYYAQRLNVTKKTIFGDVETINDYGQDLGLKIEKKQSQGIRLEGDFNQLNSLLEAMGKTKNQFSIENRRLYIIKQVYSGSQLNVGDIAKKYWISKSSIYNDIDYINNLVSKYDVSIENRDQGIVLRGDEYDIQSSLKKLIYHSLDNTSLSLEGIVNKIFTKRAISFGEDLIEIVSSNATTTIPEYYMEPLFLTACILIFRMDTSFPSKSEERASYQIDENEDLDQEIRSLLAQYFKGEVDQEVLRYLLDQINAHCLLEENISEKELYRDSVFRLIENMSRIEKLDLVTNKQLVNSLLIHFPPMINRLQNNIYINIPILNNIKRQYLDLFNLIWYALEFVEDKYNVVLNDYEVCLILLHFEIAIESVKRQHRIIILCQFGNVVAELIYRKVRKFLPKEDIVEVKNLDDMKNIDMDQVDMIISSVDYKAYGPPVVKVSPVISNQDYLNIITTYTEQLLKKDRQDKASYRTILSYLEKDLIFIGEEYETKEDLLKDISRKLEQKGYVDEKYFASLMQRERYGSTFLETGVALPHASTSTIKKSSISLITLDKSLKWDQGQVDIVFLLNFTNDDLDLYRKAITELYEILYSRPVLDELLDKKSGQEVINLFARMGGEDEG